MADRPVGANYPAGPDPVPVWKSDRGPQDLPAAQDPVAYADASAASYGVFASSPQSSTGGPSVIVATTGREPPGRRGRSLLARLLRRR